MSADDTSDKGISDLVFDGNLIHNSPIIYSYHVGCLRGRTLLTM